MKWQVLMTNKILIICDSHGTKWGAVGYAWQIKKNLKNVQVDILEYGGVSIKKILNDSRLESLKVNEYDSIIIGLGNADIHPRMPIFVLNMFKRLGLSFVKDSYFTIPPKIILSYILRLPFFIIRLVLIRYYYESYLTDKEFIIFFNKLVEKYNFDKTKLLILPLLYVNENIYTNKHNISANKINNELKQQYSKYFMDGDILNYEAYRRYYNYDFFHFKDKFHEELSDKIIYKLKS